MNIGVIIGRFQNYRLHEGYKYLIEEVLKKEEKLIIIIGEAVSNLTNKNPIPAFIIKDYLNKLLPHVTVLTLKDCPSDDFIWSVNLDNLINQNTNFDDEITLYGSRDSFIAYYNGKYSVCEIRPNFSSSSSFDRDTVQPVLNEDFLKGMIFAQTSRFPTVYSTVDVLIVKRSFLFGKFILLGRKSDRRNWCLPGGFIDPNETSKYALQREIAEECPEITYKNLKYIKDYVIFDKLYSFTKDSILTHLYKCDYVNGDLIAGDDLEELGFFSKKEAMIVINDNHKTFLKHI